MALALLACVLGLLHAAAAGHAGVVRIPAHAKRLEYGGVSRWNIAHVFESRTVSIECTREVSVYSASTEAELQAMYANGATSWCASLGWLALFNSGRRQCDITINPYGQTTVAVVPQDGHFGGAAAFECTTQERSELSVQLIATGIVGVVLVIFAPYLATSLAFRISVGGFVSVLLFSLLAALFLMRRFNRRGTASSFVALLASLSASAAGAYNFWFRFPGIPELLTNRWFLGYVAATFLLGMATSYYFDNDDAKLIDILCAALRLCGTAMLFYSLAQLWELALLATAALMLAVTFVLPRVRRAQRLSLTGPDAKAAPELGWKDSERPPGDPSPAGPSGAAHPSTNTPPGSLQRRRFLTPPWSRSRQEDDRPQEDGGDTGQARPSPHHGTPGSPHHQTSAAASFFRPSALTAPFMAHPRTPPGDGDSPLLAAGLVTNEATGRHIKVGGGTYKSLVQQGFMLDRAAGVMRSPEPQADDARGRASPGDAAARRRQSASARRRSTRAKGDGPSPAAPAGSTATSPF